MRAAARTWIGALVLTTVAAALPVLAASPAAAGPVFVTRNGAGFDLGGQPFRFGGTNNYYLHYKSQLMVDDVFSDAVAMNIKVLRAWTFLECGGDKPNSAGGCSNGADLWTIRWSNARNGPEINTGPAGLQKLDYMLARANALGIKLILPFTNNWRDFGGMDQYVTWYGLQFHDQFYTDARIRQNFKDWIAAVVNRTNSITGVPYKDDPAVFSWELANEPRCINASLPTSGTCTADTLVGWASEMSTYIKSLDANHMVSVGDEGFHPGVGGTPGSWPYNVTDGVDHARLTALPTIDFGTYHLYPQGWGQSPAQDWGTGWINDHNAVGATLGKPQVLEEFGTSDQSTRDATYTAWTNAVRTGGGDGWMFWILTGIQDDGQLYPDFDGFRIVTPSASATVLANAAAQMGGGGGDNTAPTQPGTPTVSGVTATSATLTWTASTDTGGSGLAGYTVFREQGATDPVLAQPTTNSVALTGLSPNTAYQVYVRARDGAGNLSTPSASASFTTLPGSGTCRIGYQASNWGGSTGFTANVTITNTASSTLNGWTLAFAFPAGQRVSQGWSATWAQAAGSANVTATALDWNRAIPPNGSVGIGFNGTFTTTNPAPAVFTINGNPCDPA
ncbi:cellulose binding domain-containing protein [Actinophytocola sp.]|uniref:cellulose binding domain-containing protein n=1 Tax=Actinophytocola sp. TaxID=1872138 RepID=UPI002D7EF60F|nr:cellulose binding domain-containing protein [Actinophytocola sp.]HET9137976.1 cellulose binding domain-containing protein [Actinophytocola sp.]